MEMSSWLCIPKFLTKEECHRLIDEYSNKVSKATVLEDNFQKSRNSQVCWIKRTDDMDWLFQRLTQMIREINASKFKFNIDFNCILEIQFTKYKCGDFYNWHVDTGNTNATCCRKLSITVQLSDDNTYEGGEVQFGVSDDDEYYAMREQGSVTVFSSMLRHRVKEVKKGTRFSLVAWVTGYPFN